MRTSRLLNLGARLGPVATIATRAHARLYRLTGGRFLPKWAEGMPVISLTTTGRKSGKPRSTPVVYVEDGDRLAVMPSNAGSDATPAWWLNLQANPEAEVQRGEERWRVRARRATPDEAERIWPLMRESYSGFEAYQGFTEREQPIVLLEPR
ncbi:MAG TPA: nitroreductase/quinone reductase family protein [Thermoleophilaceae bacterium]|nr:nitroreductase/quinone reductase family protein [Thermoleophilaceae bacterium]